MHVGVLLRSDGATPPENGALLTSMAPLKTGDGALLAGDGARMAGDRASLVNDRAWGHTKESRVNTGVLCFLHAFVFLLSVYDFMCRGNDT